MRHITHHMIDLETGGTGDDAAILSVGIESFTLTGKEHVNDFYVVIDTATVSGTFDPGTMKFWSEQSADAKKEIFNNPAAVPEPEAMAKVHRYLSNFYDDSEVWGNGASFDLVKLRRALSRNSLSTPWEFWAERDVRTAVMFDWLTGGNLKDSTTFKGVPHHALYDAKHQAKYVRAIADKFRGRK